MRIKYILPQNIVIVNLLKIMVDDAVFRKVITKSDIKGRNKSLKHICNTQDVENVLAFITIYGIM